MRNFVAFVCMYQTVVMTILGSILWRLYVLVNYFVNQTIYIEFESPFPRFSILEIYSLPSYESTLGFWRTTGSSILSLMNLNMGLRPWKTFGGSECNDCAQICDVHL